MSKAGQSRLDLLHASVTNVWSVCKYIPGQKESGKQGIAVSR